MISTIVKFVLILLATLLFIPPYVLLEGLGAIGCLCYAAWDWITRKVAAWSEEI